MFWCAARAYIFRDRVISERIWVWLGDPVAAFSLLLLAQQAAVGSSPGLAARPTPSEQLWGCKKHLGRAGILAEPWHFQPPDGLFSRRFI